MTVLPGADAVAEAPAPIERFRAAWSRHARPLVFLWDEAWSLHQNAGCPNSVLMALLQQGRRPGGSARRLGSAGSQEGAVPVPPAAGEVSRSR